MSLLSGACKDVIEILYIGLAHDLAEEAQSNKIEHYRMFSFLTLEEHGASL